ncbi:leucine-rich repeat-containing protein 37A3-like [Chlamydotis macqueenii]
MALLRSASALLLLVVLLAAVPCLGQRGGSCPHPCHCQRHTLDCKHAALASVPQGTRRRAFSVLDFTVNLIPAIEDKAWSEYPWAETLILRSNDLEAVKRRSLDGLFLLRRLDLSYNKIQSIEERAFEPVPFVEFINLSGNLITQIRNSTFQAWHGMQFLQKLILSHNPLTVIADTSFFKLPSVKLVDLGATQVTQQTLVTLLVTTGHLETLTLPSDVACCLCKEKQTIETPCRTIKFLCENLCTSRAPQCARTDPLAETQGEIMEAVQSRQLNASSVINLKPKEPSLGHRETVTFTVVLGLTGTDGDLSNPGEDISRRNSHSPQHLPRQESKSSKKLMLMLQSIQHMGWTSAADIRELYVLAKALTAELRTQLQKAKSIRTVENRISPLPTPAPTPLKHSLLHALAEASHSSGPLEIQSHSDAVEQTNKTDGMQDVEAVEDTEGAPSPRQDSAWTSSEQKQGDSPYLEKRNPLFDKTFGNGNPEGEPTPTERKAEQRLKTNEHFFSNLLVNNSPPTASPMLEDTAEEEGSSVRERSPAVPQTTETPWPARKKGSRFLRAPGSRNSPGGAEPQGDLLESTVSHHLRLLVQDKALRKFIAHMTRTLRMDCRLPEVHLACAKMVAKTGLLVQRLSERRDDALAGRCLQEGNVCSSVAPAGEEASGKQKPNYTSILRVLLAISVSLVITATVLGICLIEACSQNRAGTSQPQSTSKSCWKWFFQKLRQRRWRKNNNADSTQVRVGGRCRLSADRLKSTGELYDEEKAEEDEILNDSKPKSMGLWGTLPMGQTVLLEEDEG